MVLQTAIIFVLIPQGFHLLAIREKNKRTRLGAFAFFGADYEARSARFRAFLAFRRESSFGQPFIAVLAARQ